MPRQQHPFAPSSPGQPSRLAEEKTDGLRRYLETLDPEKKTRDNTAALEKADGAAATTSRKEVTAAALIKQLQEAVLAMMRALGFEDHDIEGSVF